MGGALSVCAYSVLRRRSGCSGDAVAAGAVIARRRRALLARLEVTTPWAGTVRGVCDGCLFIREAPSEALLRAYLPGQVVERYEGRGAAGEKLAVLKGAVTTVEVSPHTVVDPVGTCLEQLTGSATPSRVNPVRVKLGFDAKFLDVNNAFATVASVKGFGDHLKNVGQSLGDQLVALLTLRNVFLLVVVVVVCWLISRLMLRVR